MDRLREMADIAKEKTLQAAEIAWQVHDDLLPMMSPSSRSCTDDADVAALALLTLFVVTQSLAPQVCGGQGPGAPFSRPSSQDQLLSARTVL